MSSGCSPRSFIIDADILPGLASAISVIALFSPIENISSIFSILADLFSHFKYGPNLPVFKVISFWFSGLTPNDFGNEHKNWAFSKSILSSSNPFGIDTFFKSSFTSLSFLVFFFFFVGFSSLISSKIFSYCK